MYVYVHKCSNTFSLCNVHTASVQHITVPLTQYVPGSSRRAWTAGGSHFNDRDPRLLPVMSPKGTGSSRIKQLATVTRTRFGTQTTQ